MIKHNLHAFTVPSQSRITRYHAAPRTHPRALKVGAEVGILGLWYRTKNERDQKQRGGGGFGIQTEEISVHGVTGHGDEGDLGFVRSREE